MLRFAHIFVINSLLAVIVISNAFILKRQFYPSVIYITRSKFCVFIIFSEIVLLAAIYAKLLIKIFFIELKQFEIEHLRENIYPACLEACVAMAMFRKHGHYSFIAKLFTLFFVKCFHLLANSRLDMFGRVVRLPKFYHERMIGLLLFLGIIDIHQIVNSAVKLKTYGYTIELVFAFEYSVLLVSVIGICGNYILNCIEMRRNNMWEEKVVYANYLDLLIELCKLVLHVAFISLMLLMRFIPLFIIRPFVKVVTKLKDSVSKAWNSRTAISNLSQYPNPSEEELSRLDSTCVVCRDTITGVITAKKLPCSHIFHISCLKAWFRRQPRCPTCRFSIATNEPNQERAAN